MEKIKYKVSGQTLIYHMPKELDHHVAQKICKELDMLVDSYMVKELVLDFVDTEFMDSSGVGVIIGRSKTMHFHNGKLCVANMGKRVQTIFCSAGLQKIVEVKEV